jgi:hypothetical protein
MCPSSSILSARRCIFRAWPFCACPCLAGGEPTRQGRATPCPSAAPQVFPKACNYFQAMALCTQHR